MATPDFTVTPQVAAFGSPDQLRAAIVRVNTLLGQACAVRGVRFVPEIFSIPEGAATDLSLVVEELLGR